MKPTTRTIQALSVVLSLSSPFMLSSAFASPAAPAIVGGTEAARGEFAYIVSLQKGFSGHFCGGSLIRKNWVLTAAHCVKGGTSGVKIVTGLYSLNDPSGSESFSPKRVIIHPDYGRKTSQDSDYALIQLNGSSKFSPIGLNTSEISVPNDEASAPRVTVAGWGTTTEGGSSLPNVLRKVTLPLVSETVCAVAYPGEITDRMLCAGLRSGGKDSCQGDSGGPLVRNGRLVGVVSWGAGCARRGMFGIYSKVNAAASWISSQAQ
jgi:trypsin